MAIRKAGSLWLIAHLELTNIQLTHRLYIGTRDKVEVGSDGSIDQTYGPKYAPKKDDVFSHIEFMLKYDDLNLDLLSLIFFRLEEQKLTNYIPRAPLGAIQEKWVICMNG